MGTISLRVLFLLFAIIGLSACSPQRELNHELVGEALQDGIFSNRPQNMTHGIYILKLKTTALFQTIEIKDGVKKIDQGQV